MTALKSPITRVIARLIVALGTAAFMLPASAQLNQALQAQVEADRAAAAAQQRINEIRERTQDAASRYAQALADADSLEKYNNQLSEQVSNQQEEISSIEKQLLDIETTNREVQPLMQQMVDALEQFVSLDVPFLQDERKLRVANLQAIMGRADITISEKYRRILEAYQIELEYGRTLDAYAGVKSDGRTVEFVRLGRISLMYITLDRTESGYWDANKGDWVVDNNYIGAIEEALRVARKDGAPELLTVPVPAPQEVRS
ncbi:MAG: DUF3450 domain-containing protein [Gammaproteobacteria bacterium]|nr:DUF3450 domain-containing protein [Gammaproteobacteria bacterium]